MISKSKPDQFFTDTLTVLNGVKRPYRGDRNKNGDGLVLYVNDEIVSDTIKLPPLLADVETMGIKVILEGQIWLAMGIYKPPNHCRKCFMKKLSKILDSCHYGNCIVMGDFTCRETDFLTLKTHYNLANIIKSPTCNKSPANPSYTNEI